MKPEDIINSLGEISDSLLLQADIPVRRRSLRKILSLSAAAVLLVCAFTVPLVFERGNGVEPPVSVPSEVLNNGLTGTVASTPSNYSDDALNSSLGGNTDTSDEISKDASNVDLGEASDDYSNDFSADESSGDISTDTEVSIPEGPDNDPPLSPDNGNTPSPDTDTPSSPDDEKPTDVSTLPPEDLTINMTFVAGSVQGGVNGGGDNASTEIWGDASTEDVEDAALLEDKTLSDSDSETLLVMLADMMMYNEKLYPPTLPADGPETELERQNAYASALGYDMVYCCMFMSDIDNIRVYIYRSKTGDGYLMVKNMNFYALTNEEYNQIIYFVRYADSQ